MSEAGSSPLHTNDYDEAFASPTVHAMQLALRTRQVIADGTGVTQVDGPIWRVECRR